jgi:hypothetical protein
MNPMISLFEKLTSQDNNRPPGIILRSSQAPTPVNTDTGRHLIKIESEVRRGSEIDKTFEEFTIREKGVSLSE